MPLSRWTWTPVHLHYVTITALKNIRGPGSLQGSRAIKQVIKTTVTVIKGRPTCRSLMSEEENKNNAIGNILKPLSRKLSVNMVKPSSRISGTLWVPGDVSRIIDPETFSSKSIRLCKSRRWLPSKKTAREACWQEEPYRQKDSCGAGSPGTLRKCRPRILYSAKLTVLHQGDGELVLCVYEYCTQCPCSGTFQRMSDVQPLGEWASSGRRSDGEHLVHFILDGDPAQVTAG